MTVDGRPVVYTLDEVAQVLQVSRRTVDRIVKDGKLRAVHVGTGRTHRRVTERALLAYLGALEGRRRL